MPKNTHNSKYTLSVALELIIIIILSLLAGYQVIYTYDTKDYLVYKGHYESITWGNYLGDGIYFELLYKLFAAFSALLLNFEYELYASLLAFTALSIKFYLFSKRPYAFYLKLSYLITLYPFYECLRIRAALAIALVFLAIELRNHKILSLFFLLIGVNLHYSLLPTIAAWTLYYHLDEIKKLKKYLSLFILSGILILMTYNSLAFMLDYLDARAWAFINENEGYFNIWLIPKHLMIGVMSYLMIKNISGDFQKNYHKHVTLLFISIIFWILSVLTFQINLLALSLLDISIVGYFLVATQAIFKRKALIRYLFFSIVIIDILFKIFELPVIIINILK